VGEHILLGRQTSFEYAPIKPIVAMILLLCTLLGFALWMMVEETNRIDAQRATISVAAAVFDQAENLAQVASTYASAEVGFDAVYRAPGPSDAFAKTWGAATRDARRYDLMFALRPDNQIAIGFERGAPSTIDYRSFFGGAFSALVANLKSKKSLASAGLVQTRRGLAIISVATVISESPENRALIAASGEGYLVFAKFVTPTVLKDIGGDHWIQGLHTGYPRSGEISTVLKDPAGDPAVTFSWRPLHPGRAALGESVPWLFVGVVLFLVAAAFLSRQGLRVLNELNSSVMTDSLSHLPNRRALHHDIETQLNQSVPLALAFIDLDGFKAVNDNYGHHTGDHLIIKCAKRLTSIFGKVGTVYRMGGDEFAVVVAGKAAQNLAQERCETVLEQLGSPFRIDQQLIAVGASIGLAFSEDGSVQLAELLRQADVAMYAAKGAGKMRLEWFNSSFDDKKAHKHKLELALRRALQQNQFHVEYQPLVDAAGKYVASLEALLRWTRSDGSMVSPAEFIPIAEESGLINAIGRWVLERACSDALHWEGVQLSVNVSAAQLRNPAFSAQLAKILADTGFPASRLELEVTETFLVVDPVTAGRTLEAIRQLGVKIALDDFGTGYASIGFLRKFKFDKLKIDRSLVADAASNAASRTLLQASVAIASALNMKVTAEGVETQAQADLARIAGCDQLQGWLYFKAMKAAIIDQHLKPIKMLETQMAA
jgi:diguanylate cyclase (GGDEF)-like protein